MVIGLNAQRQYKEVKNNDTKYFKNKQIFPENTMIGALAKYIQNPNEKFQPMNANFGILPKLSEKIKDKKLKYEKLADRAIYELKSSINNN